METLDITLIVDDPAEAPSLAQALAACGCRAHALVRNGAPPSPHEPGRPLLLAVGAQAAGVAAWIRDLRASQPATPLCVLFDDADDTAQVVALEMGADAVLVRPVSAHRLTAQLRALARRDPGGAAGGVELVPGAREARLDGRALELTDSEYDLLRLLSRHPGRPINRDVIKREIRGLPYDVRDRSIDLVVVRLRRKLGDDPRRPRYIRTVRGVGYMFMTPAR
ncbi:MAG TPA: response regulator transcription factor [Candidatus Krumholzibacteria bacterium]|nr:response regulator transcription factor [Candidatus Krumholzibacteria bacterium]HRX52085.1 response regulator transcription factor [Candidatus Krumholzibacteria bacterium]